MLMHYCVHNACCKITNFFDPTLREVRMCTGALTNKSVRYKNAVASSSCNTYARKCGSHVVENFFTLKRTLSLSIT